MASFKCTSSVFTLSSSLLLLLSLLSATSNAQLQCAGGPVNDNLRLCDQADIIFVLDSSGSVNESNWGKTLDFVQDVIVDLNTSVSQEETRIGVVSYSNRATPFVYLNQFEDVEEMKRTIDSIPYKDQETNTSGAFWFVREEMLSEERGHRRTVPVVTIAVTDGGSNRDAHLTVPYADELKAAGSLIIVIAVHSDELNYTELYAIASGPEFVMNATSYTALSSEIRGNLRTVTCDIPVACNTEADITFILDSSGSVRQENFDKMKEFVKCMVNELNVGLQRVALETFSNNAEPEFYLNDYDSRYYVYQAIDQVLYDRGTTNTAEALRQLRELIYQENRGDRKGVRNIAVLFTDGGSNDFEETLRQASLARESNITLIVVAVSGWLNLIEIKEIASDPDDANVFLVRDFDDIVTITAGLKKILCNALNECQPNPCKNGGTCLDGDNTYHCVCPQQWAGINCDVYCPEPADIVIAIDESGSVGQENFYVTLDFVKHFIDSLNVGHTRVGIETFANQASVKFHLNQYDNVVELLNAVSFPYSAGTTNTADAIGTMRMMFNPDNGNREGIQDYFLLITDGQSNDLEATWQQALAARAEGIFMMAVGVDLTSNAGVLELRGIASDPDDQNVIHVDDFENLMDIAQLLLEGVCMSAQPCQSNPCQGGGTCVNKLNSYVCECPYGRTGINCERHCDGEADVVFVVDGSGSIRENRFETVREYMISVIEQLEVSQDRVRVGMVLYSDNAQIEFKLNTFNSKEDVIQAIRRVQWIRGRTNTVAGLILMKDEMFVEEAGDRETVFNFAIVITDGESNINQGSTIPTAIESRIKGIHIIVVTVTVMPNLEIKGIASDPDEVNIYYVENFSMLPTLTSALVNGMCDSVNECDSNPCSNGGICLDGLSQYMCFCQDEYTGVNCERKCGRRMDVVFALDTSGSVEESFELILRLTRLIVEGLNFAGGRTRVGLLTFSDQPLRRFHLNQYQDKQSVLNAIAFIQDRGRTNTAGAIDYIWQRMFTTVNGDRPGDDNYAIVITDGRSNVNQQNTIPAANQARSADIAMVAVGIGENGRVDRAELNGIANDPDNQYAFVMQYESELEQTANSILDAFCQDFVF